MDSPINSKKTDFGSDHSKLDAEFCRVADATCYWFAAVIVFAVLAAGVIVYHGANSEFTTASNDPAPALAQADPISPAPLLQQR